MKFTTLITALTSASSILAAPGGYSYYRANDVDARIAIDINLKVKLDAGNCDRGIYGGYDAYRCRNTIDVFADLSIKINLGIDIGPIHFYNGYGSRELISSTVDVIINIDLDVNVVSVHL
ncbi:hypothetical protein CONCODRAFT_7701 [Conidiobolus coronatus NRRL 28638]|uniref:Uncharacterized protein n=1 Tax=Conidiobolus coronatus (strain ATCC 28846 / CBS 209.66 / NRRL 28638) TaxID=796925 RepID=A0A137P4G1_CONC2|nr:hypothetical protein CONCODRAFT_7701 [Conidiobolus coronatus NRRL 28638]|eukprot:KXN69811.1 hypothetical protein CONCODRAFT_7701 [Conidiobolus coronatus NRRL 28638]